VDAIDEKILSLLVEDGRRTFDDIGQHVGLSASAAKRRVDHLRETGSLRGFTAVLDYRSRGWNVEALIHLYYAAGAIREEAADDLRDRPEIIEVWMVTGEADAIAHVRARDGADLERFLLDLKAHGLIERTRTEIVMSQLVPTRPVPVD
jgi:Lrp/AsnC family leucine-responsive transcriptional regulator